MTPNPYLQHLIPDPTYGYLFPHRMTVAALAVTNEYQIKKHRPSLTEGQHWIKITGSDHIDRLYYTRDGLLLLCDLVNTPAAQELKQALVSLSQPGGALVQTLPSPSHLYPQPPASRVLYTEPAAYISDCPEEFSDSPGYPIATQSNHPAALVAAHLAPQLERSIERSIAARIPAQPVQDTAALLFQQQQLDLQKQQAWTDNLLKAQQQTADLRPVNRTTITTTSTVTNPAKQVSDWLNQQDIWAFTLVSGCLIALIGVGSFLMVASAVKTQTPSYPPQAQTQPWR